MRKLFSRFRTVAEYRRRRYECCLLPRCTIDERFLAKMATCDALLPRVVNAAVDSFARFYRREPSNSTPTVRFCALAGNARVLTAPDLQSYRRQAKNTRETSLHHLQIRRDHAVVRRLIDCRVRLRPVDGRSRNGIQHRSNGPARPQEDVI